MAAKTTPIEISGVVAGTPNLFQKLNPRTDPSMIYKQESHSAAAD
ncbi:MAG: hypothetical protein R2684_16195 [Pyrinomonadaceae bacterium]